MRKRTLTELWVEDNWQIKKGVINMIVAPVGSGKTYFVFEKLIKKYSELNRIIYLVDTSNLKEAVIKDKQYFETVMAYDRNPENNFKNILSSKNKVTVMTYSQFGHLIKNDKETFNSVDLFVCDEAHNLIKYSNRFDRLVENEEDKVYLNTIIKLKEIAKTKEVVFLTATHRNIKRHFELKAVSMHTFDYSSDIRIRSLKEDFSYFFNNINNLKLHLEAFNGFIDGEKCLIYTDRIDNIKTIKEMVESIEIKFGNTVIKKLKVVGLWSINSSKEMDEEQLATRKSIIETGLVPKDIDILIINSSYETGININDESIQLVVVNSTNADTQIQARGRVRKNIKGLYVRSLSEETKLKITLKDKWLDKPLNTKEKKELCLELNLVNQNGRALSWTSIKRILKESEYTVIDTQIRLKLENSIKSKPMKVSIVSE